MRPMRDCTLVALLPILTLGGISAASFQPAAAAPQAVNETAEPAPGTDWRMDMLPESVKARLAATYLTEIEKQELRIKHGVYLPTDLSTPDRVASAALLRGDFTNPIFGDAAVGKLTRAAALLRRGDSAEALALAEGDTTLQGMLVRARALVALGRVPEAVAALDPLVEAVQKTKIDDAAELLAGVQGVALRARLAGEKTGGGEDYKAMLSVLARVREELDKLSPLAALVEAQILYEKDAGAQASEALQQALPLSPSSVDAWMLAGLLAVDSFDIEKVEKITEKIDELSLGEPAAGETRAAGASPIGAYLLARGRLRQSDGAAALGLVNKALEREPKNLKLLAMQAAATAATYDFAQADDLLARLDKISPGNPEGQFEVGRVLSEMRQYSEAAGHLQVAAERAPFWIAPLNERGLLEMQAGRDGEALAALETAEKIDTFNVRAANSLKLVRDLATYARVESEHYMVRYMAATDELLAKEMLEPLEANYRRVTGKDRGGIDYPMTTKTIIELLPDHRAFGVRITGMAQIHTIAASTGPIIAMESPREGPNHLGLYDWVRVLRHEFVHTVTLARTKNRLPHWFTEASAVYLEDAPRAWNTVQLITNAYNADALFDLDEINIAFVRPKRPADRQLAYAQGHWMYEYIIERWGNKAPLDLMDAYASGKREAEAYQTILGISRADFVKEFKVWAGEQLKQWGVVHSDDMKSASELLGNDTEVAMEVIDNWLETYPNHPELLSLKVQKWLESNDGTPTAEMIPTLKQYASARPVAELPHKLLARLFLDGEGDGKQAAIPHLEWLDIREEKSPTFAMELARRYAAESRWTEAWAKALRATQLAPFVAAPRELAATIAIKKGDIAAAEHQIRGLMWLEPNQPLHQQRLDALQKLRN